MIKLLVKQPGLFITIPGIPSFRSPAEIDITKVDMNLVITELRRYGVEDYKIISGTIEPKKDLKVVKIKNKSVNKNSNIEKKLNKIEKLLEKIIEGNISTTQKSKKFTDVICRDNIENDMKDEFIPSINTSTMKIKGSISTKHESIDDISEQVELLKKINGDKK